MGRSQKMLICTIYILLGLLTRSISADDAWLEPNAWEIHSPTPNICPVCDVPDVSNEIGITTTYYKKMISYLFSRDNLKVNPKTGQLDRTLIFSLTAAQLKIIENSSDIRDFNAAVMAIVKSAKEPVQDEPTPTKSDSWLWILKYIWGLFYSMASQVVIFFSYTFLYNSETRFAVVVFAVMLAIWFIHKRYNKNLILIVIVSFIIFGYFCSYIECNRKLEAEKFIKFIKESEPDESNYFSKLLGKFFKQSKKDQKIEEIKDASKVKLGYCRPDDVAIMYFNEMFFNQLQVIVVKMVESMNIIQNTIPFPFNYMGMIALPFLFVLLMPLLFQYVFNPVLWSKSFRNLSAKHHHQKDEIINNNTHQGDRLSGENLKILFEVLKNKSDVEEKPKNSAVEDVKDSLPQAISAKLDDSLSAEETCEVDDGVPRNNKELEEEKSKKES